MTPQPVEKVTTGVIGSCGGQEGGLAVEKGETRRIPTVNARIVGQHFFRAFLCFESLLNLHMLVDEWN